MKSKRIFALTIILALCVSLAPGGLATEVRLDSATLQNANAGTQGGADAQGEGASGVGKKPLDFHSFKFGVGALKGSGVLDFLPLESLEFDISPVTSLKGVEKAGAASAPSGATDSIEMSLGDFQKKEPELYKSLFSILKSFGEQRDEITEFAGTDASLKGLLINALSAFGHMNGSYVGATSFWLNHYTLNTMRGRLTVVKLLFDRMREKAGFSEELAALATAIDTLLDEIRTKYGDGRRSQTAVQWQDQTGGPQSNAGSGNAISPISSLDTGGFVDNYTVGEPVVPDGNTPDAVDPDVDLPDADDPPPPDTLDAPGDDTPQ